MPAPVRRSSSPVQVRDRADAAASRRLSPVCRVYTKPAIRLRRSLDATRALPRLSVRRPFVRTRSRSSVAITFRRRTPGLSREPVAHGRLQRERPTKQLLELMPLATRERLASRRLGNGPRTTGPNRTRTSRSTSSPSASHRRRTSRFCPSAIVSSSSDVRLPSGRASTARGAHEPVLELDAATRLQRPRSAHCRARSRRRSARSRCSGA